MRSVTSFNDGWVFHDGFSPALTTALQPGTAISLPHNAVELPFSYFDEKSYQHAFTYQKAFDADESWAGKEVVLRFDAAMADAVVYVNGQQAVAHKDGYTPFEVRLSDLVKPGMQAEVVRESGAGAPVPAEVLRVGEVFGPSRLTDDPIERAGVHDVDCVLKLSGGDFRIGQRVLVRFKR